MRERKKSEGGRKGSVWGWVQASKNGCSMVVPLWVRRTRGRHCEGGKRREQGRMKLKRKEENKGEAEESSSSSLGWAWPVLYNTDIH